ncbi:redoxin domain-containing protein [Sulfoacidibacillus thermotolerans]|uniref:Thioredoxin domain-containing protein n=1 Tax=Sulfoacidibacillus thermotolerans TaxID=1765684 RepID=A0A2U3D7Y9_SULT2|nr:redoxin domain-containing protein [Sulfoacidibacillus thermotolerans]PWI57398.1 hypothetical protein BM613_08720 [Sulfoacidibacillus thermotolerans]
MDMTNNPSPLILHLFYTSMLWQFPLFLFILLVLFWFTKSVRHVSLIEWIQEGLRSPTGSIDQATREVFQRRRLLRIGLGALWIIDGLLQAQPDMSSEFIPNIVNPMVSAQPPFLNHLLEPLVVLWSQSPIQYDLLAIWIQVGIGMLLIFGGNSLLTRIGLWLSLGWGLAVWIVGEGFGGVFSGGATWLAGAPGSVLFYMVGAAFLLLSEQAWKAGRVATYLRFTMVVLWLWAAFAQALPASGFWTGQGLSSTTLSMAEMPQPSFLASLLYGVAHILNAYPVFFNATFVIWMATLGFLWLWQARLRIVVPLTLVWVLLTWVIGQDFGVLGGLGTDPNSSPVVALLVVAGAARVEKAEELLPSLILWVSKWKKTFHETVNLRLFTTAAATIFSLAISAVVVVHLSHVSAQTEAANAPADQAAMINGGVTPVGNRPAPNFTLVDQYGKKVSLSQLAGKVVVLTFLDPVCYDDCPVIAAEMQGADRTLGSLQKDVEFVAVAANPTFHSLADVQAFDEEHGLTHMKNFLFLTSNSLASLQRVWNAYYFYVGLPKVGMVQHTDGIYFLSKNLKEVWFVGGTGDSAPTLMGSYAALISHYVKQLLS